MNEVIINNWNRVVGSNDQVYILGDFSWADFNKTKEFLGRLNGYKMLIQGNHDYKNIRDKVSGVDLTMGDDIKDSFIYIVDYNEIKDNDRNVVLCHYPIPCFNRHYYGSFHLYGHVHNGFEWTMMEKCKHEMETTHNIPCNMYNVGCMMPWMDYTPKTLDQIIEGYNAEKDKNKTEE